MRNGSYYGGSTIIRVGSDGTKWDNFDSYSTTDSSFNNTQGLKQKKSNKKKFQKALEHSFAPPDKKAMGLTFIAQYAGDKIFQRKNAFNPPKVLRNEINQTGGIEQWINDDQERLKHYNKMIDKYKKLV